jgi:hypothetical protein
LGEESDDFGVDLVGVSGGCGPDESAGFGLVESPAVVGVVVVVRPVHRAEVAGGCLPALRPGRAVVEVAGLGWVGAGREPARLVPDDDVLGQLRRRQVPLAADVEDGPDTGSVSSLRQVPSAAMRRATAAVIGP